MMGRSDILIFTGGIGENSALLCNELVNTQDSVAELSIH